MISYCGVRVGAGGGGGAVAAPSPALFLVGECNKTDYTPLCGTMGEEDKRCQFPKPGQEHLINGKHAGIGNLYPQPTTLLPSPEVLQTGDTNCLQLCGLGGHVSVNNLR